MFETFTAHAREAIDCAQREAREMGYETVEVEHLLLGLFGCQDQIVSRVWTDFGLMIQPVRETIQQRLGVGHGPGLEGPRPFSGSAKDSLRSAYRFGMGEPGPEHVLIVLMRRGEGGASEVLVALGVDHSGLFEELDFGDL
jgi:ATP-dependent Clp protease ATP-binding subunit ClpC